jgi:hypothetical protein
MKEFLLSMLFLALLGNVFGQSNRYRLEEERSNAGTILQLNFSHGGQIPGGDIADRFGKNLLAGLSADLYTKDNWIFGVQGDFLFGKEVKTDVLANLKGSEGAIYSDDGGLTDIRLRQRGLLVSAHVGKVFAFSDRNKRSGLRVTVGGGFLQHKIRIQDEPQVFVSSLGNDYKKGYDRLANGFALTEFIGYQLIANNRLVNFSIGVEFTQGFTQGRRSYNFDTRTPGLEKRFDLLHGYRLTWTLPLFIGENPDEISY